MGKLDDANKKICVLHFIKPNNQLKPKHAVAIYLPFHLLLFLLGKPILQLFFALGFIIFVAILKEQIPFVFPGFFDTALTGAWNFHPASPVI